MILKRVMKQLGLKPGDKAKLKIFEGKKAIIPPSLKPLEDPFIRA
ncbi:MAG: hypothetical protein ACUVTM_08370 [Candidatus Bathyarchaeia archaeon]